MAGGDVSKLVGAVKDALHGEWAEFKKSGLIKDKPVCLYAIGGQRDTPVSSLASVSKGVCEWEECLKQTVDPKVDKTRGVLPSEVMVGAEGQISLYPIRRHVPVEVPASTPGSTISSASRAKDVKTPPAVTVVRGKVLSPKALLMNAFEQSSNYMLDHVKRVSENAFIAGNNKILFMCLASAAIVRSRLNVYKDILKQPTSNLNSAGPDIAAVTLNSAGPEVTAVMNLTAALGRCGEIVEFMMQNILSYNCDLLHSALLHDASSHDWTHPKPYHENERPSLAIQMWAFYMQGVRNDLWRYTSPRISESILASIFTDTLSLMVTRYAQIEHSDVRMSQYSADIVAILTIIAATLPSLIASPAMFFSVRIHESVALPIHRRAELLIKIAALKCAPIETIARVFHKGFDNALKRTGYPESRTSIESTPNWLNFLNPILFPKGKSSLRYVGDNAAVYLTFLTVASRPQPQFSLLVRGLLMRRYLGTKVLLSGLQDEPGQVTAGEPCKGPLCMPHLCAPPLLPHTVYAAVCQILLKCTDNVMVLSRIISPGIKESGSWDSLDRTQVWNVQRPPWHHALVQLVTPSVVGVVSEVIRAVPQLPPAKPAHPSQQSVRLEHHLAAWTLQLLTGIEAVADTMPHAVVYAAHTINASLPPTIKPTGGHVITQLVVSALYSTINSRSSLDDLNDFPISDGQWDMMIAVGERLCSLHDGNYDTHLKQMTLALLAQLEDLEDDEEEDTIDEYSDEDVIDCMCLAHANTVMASAQGQHALGAIWEFLKRNMEWMQEALSVPAILPLTSHFPPTPLCFTPKPPAYNPIYYYKRMIHTRLDNASIMNFKGDWETVLWNDLGMPKETIVNFIRQRPEFQEGAYLTREETAAVKKMAPFLKNLDDPDDSGED
ncbi:uncharacterized protein KIAA0825 homolog isoform X2 [Macrobrachium nipponense]|uniref:uncharacterized protein KIAA0825 homolog isoform X2 n=1 Tax=Macrobrachium nipponense TaxID=159736 RepID=UPI0030C7AF07